MQPKKQQLEANMEQHTSSKLGKMFVKVVYCHPARLTNMQNTSGFPDSSVGKESTCSVGDLGLIPGLRRCPGEWKGYGMLYWMKHKLEARFLDKISITSNMQMSTTLMAESKEELKSLDESERGE